MGQAGLIKATVGSITAEARARVIPPLPWNETFDSYPVGSVPLNWVSATTVGKFQVTELDGQKVLEKVPTDTLFKRMRVFMGPADWSNYTVEADIRIPEKKRQIGDAGIIAQRYTLFAFGNNQRLEMNSWQPEVARAASARFTFMTLGIASNCASRITPMARRAFAAKLGRMPRPSPPSGRSTASTPFPTSRAGIFADAQYGVYFDTLKVTPNQ